MTVTGRVNLLSGGADTQAAVYIPGKDRRAQAVDAHGAFAIPDVTPPYDLFVARKDLGRAFVIKGLTRTTLAAITLDAAGDEHGADNPPPPSMENLIKGTVTGQQTTSGPSTTQVTLTCADNKVYLARSESTGSYSIHVVRAGPLQRCTLFALQSKPGSNGIPAGYLAYGRRDNVTIQDGELVGQDITMSPLTNSTLTGHILLPRGYTLDSISLGLLPDASSSLSLFSQAASQGAFSFAVPLIPQATFAMSGKAIGPALDNPGNESSSTYTYFLQKGLAAGTSNLTIPVPEAARLSEPADNARDVTRATVFSWSLASGGISSVIFTATSADAPPYEVTVIQSGGTQAMLPDLSPLDMPLPTSAAFSWNVLSEHPVVSMDEELEIMAQKDPLPGASSASICESRAFTTAAAP